MTGKWTYSSPPTAYATPWRTRTELPRTEPANDIPQYDRASVREVPDVAAIIAAARPPWMARGSCATSNDPGLWHSDDPRECARAVFVCTTCPVWRACLTHALTAVERDGVWGGTMPGRRWPKRHGAGEPMSELLDAGFSVDEVCTDWERMLDPADDAAPGELAPAVVEAVRRVRVGIVADAYAAVGRPVPLEIHEQVRAQRQARAHREAAKRAAVPVADPVFRSVDAA